LANHKSALKRAGQNENRRLRNKMVKTRVKNVVKDVRVAAGLNEKDDASKKLDIAKSTISRAAKKGVITKKTASRKVSRLAKMINKIDG
jgi:small subunit ribosomal protein S20